MDISALKPVLTPTEFENAIRNLININFKDHHLFHVIEERRLYNPAVSEYIWEQNKGRRPHVCEVYFDGEFVGDIPSNVPPNAALMFIKQKVAWIIAEKAKKIADAK